MDPRLLINREAGLRTEIMINDIPESVEFQASLGSAISIDMTVPEQFRTSEGFCSWLYDDSTNAVDGQLMVACNRIFN